MILRLNQTTSLPETVHALIWKRLLIASIYTEARLHFAYTSNNMTDNATEKTWKLNE